MGKLRGYLGQLFYEHLFIRILKAAYQQLYFISHVFLYGDIHYSDFVSPRASVRNFRRVHLGGDCVINPHIAWAEA